MLNQAQLVSSDQDVLGGVPVFVGTRVPAKTLIDYLQRGHSIDEFLDDFPTVSRHQAQELLACFHRQLIASV